MRSLGEPPNEPRQDWAVLVRRSGAPLQEPPAPASFHAKLRVGLTSASRVGDPVTASVIGPERFLGGLLTGRVEEAGGPGLRLAFHRLDYRGRTIPIRSTVTSFVNSVSDPDVDERGRRIVIRDGVITSDANDFTLGEGGEVRMQVWMVP